MIAERIYAVKGVAGYVALCDDGEYHRLTPSMRIMSGILVHDYVPRRIGRGAEDITDTPEGRALLGTANSSSATMSTHDRARAAASARWGNRGPSVVIRVDESAARALETLPETERRSVASDAIRAAVDARRGSC